MPPPYGVVPEGFEAKPLDVIETEMKEGLRAAISPTLNLGSKSLLGQFVGVVASQLRQLWEAGQANYAARDRAQATDAALDSIGELTGTPRDPATKSQAMMTITLAAGTYPAGALRVNVTSDATKIFENAAEITTAGATLTGQLFTSVDTGPISAPAGTLVNITTPYPGFSAPTNPADAVLGEEREEDPPYRERQEEELQKGSASVDSIRSALLENDDITWAIVLENETDLTDANGLPPHSVAPVVEGATDQVVAEIVFNKKAGGPRSHGSTVVTVYDEQGNPHPIGITRPTVTPYKTRVTYSWLADSFVSSAAADTAVNEAVEAAWLRDQKMAVDIIISTYVAAVRGVAGIIDCSVEVSTVSPTAYTSSNVSIGVFERASYSAADFVGVPTMVNGIP